MDAHPVVLLPVREVETERPDRRAQAAADSVTECEAHVAQLVRGVAGIDERGEAERRGDPVVVLRARQRVVAAADDGAALLDAEWPAVMADLEALVK